MTEELLQFAISQYLDGNLPADEVAALEKRLTEDPHAQRLLKEYRLLDSLMVAGLKVPETNWDSLALEISKAVELAAPPVPGSLANEADAAYRTAWAWRPFAIAASVLICAGLALIFVHRQSTPESSESQQIAETPIPPTPPDYPAGENAIRNLTPPAIVANAAVIQVDVLVADALSGTAVADVQVGPGKPSSIFAATAINPMDLTAQPTSLSIASVPRPGQYEDQGVTVE